MRVIGVLMLGVAVLFLAFAILSGVWDVADIQLFGTANLFGIIGVGFLVLSLKR